MPADPKARFLQYVGAETDGGKRPKGKGFITEKQRQNLNPAYLDYLVQRNKKKNHFPKRVSDDKWAEVKVDLKAKQRGPQVAGNNKKGKAQKQKKQTKPKKPKTKNVAAPSAAPPSSPRRSGRIKDKNE